MQKHSSTGGCAVLARRERRDVAPIDGARAEPDQASHAPPAFSFGASPSCRCRGCLRFVPQGFLPVISRAACGKPRRPLRAAAGWQHMVLQAGRTEAGDEAREEEQPDGAPVVGQAVRQVAHQARQPAGNQRALVVVVGPHAVACAHARDLFPRLRVGFSGFP